MYLSCQAIPVAVCDVTITHGDASLEFTLSIRTCQAPMEDEAIHRARRQSVHIHTQLHIRRPLTATAAVTRCRCTICIIRIHTIISSSSIGR